MNKGEKQGFIVGLSIMNEQDRVLTAGEPDSIELSTHDCFEGLPFALEFSPTDAKTRPQTKVLLQNVCLVSS